MAIFGINTPELGISEWVGDRLGIPRNAQGGSNLFSGSNVQAPQTLGAATTNLSAQYPNYDPNKLIDTKTGQPVGTGSVTKVARPTGNGVGTSPSAPPAAPAPSGGQPSGGMFDDLINPILQGLEGQVGVSQSNYNANVASAQADALAKTNTVNSNTQENVNSLNKQQTQAEGSTQNAIADAQRGFSEMAQGLQARYGGTTGTGGFAETILGGQTQRNIAGYRQQLSQNIQNIQDTMGHVKLVAQQALAEIEANKTAQLNNIKFQLDNQINAIRMKQGEIQSNKAKMTVDAINIYRQAQDAINMQDWKFKQDLYAQQQAAEQKLAYAYATQQQAVKNTLITNPVSGEPVGVFQQQGAKYSYDPYQNGQFTGGQMILPGQEKKNQTQGQDELTSTLDRLISGAD